MTEHKFSGKIDLGYRNTTVHTTQGFNILGMVPARYFNTYVVTICFMQGDADGYEYEKIEIRDEQILKEFVDFCFRCAVAYPHGKGGCDSYEHVEGYYRFVDAESEDEDEDNPVECLGLLDWWPTQEGEYYTSFDWFKVEYYGATGQACTVEIITEA